MATKIVIDAGHGGSVDPGAVYKGREEKNDNLKLAMAVGKILSENGVDVVYTRTDDTYQTPFEKAQIANEDGADFFLSFHRNSSPLPNQYSGAESLVYDLSGTKAELAKNINGALGELGFKDLGVSARPGLDFLRRTRMPAVLIETGFINNDSDNALFDEKFDDIAEAIAYAILGTLDETKTEEPEHSSSVLYRVQTGQFRQKANADNQLYELQDMGYPAFILEEDGFYKVQVGAFHQLENAIKMERGLRLDGYSTWITTR